MEIRKIFFDMDGVLADFDRGVIELCKREPLDQNLPRTDAEDDALWASVRTIPNFYYKLQPMEGAVELFHRVRQVYGDRVEILTGIPRPKRGILTAGEDKIRWVRDYLDTDVVVNVVLRAEKPQYCTGPDCILIDDYTLNIQEWEAEGGTGILFESANQVREALGL